MKARFAYYATTPNGSFPVYKTANGSEVTGEGLHALGLPIPLTPNFHAWNTLVYGRRRCGFCWAEIDGSLRGLHDHVAGSHPEKVAA